MYRTSHPTLLYQEIYQN